MKARSIVSSLPIIEILLSVLALWYFICWIISGHNNAGLALMERVSPYVIGYIGLRLLFSSFPKQSETIIISGICVWGIVEAGCGLWQVLGRGISNHTLYSLTGHFSNPGPYGGFIACTMAVAFAEIVRNKKNYLAAVALAFGFLVLPASMSRAAWLGLGASVLLAITWEGRFCNWVKRHFYILPLTCILLMFLLGGAFLMKKESAVGRLHIWDIEARAIASHPIFGAGPGFHLGAYGDAQEAYFRKKLNSHEDSFSSLPPILQTRVKAAGSPEYAFNEFMGIGMETGLPGLSLALAVMIAGIVKLHRRRSPMAAGVLCWAIFACASYPLSVTQLCVLLMLFLASVVRDGRPTRTVGQIMATALGLSLCLGGVLVARVLPDSGLQHSVDYRVLYDEGHSLFQAGRYAESREILDRGALLSSDPMFDIIIGRDLEAMCDYEGARSAYLKAHYMTPGRLYPLMRLMRLQVATGQDTLALQTARALLNIPVNPRNLTMQRLHDEAKAVCDSLISFTLKPGD